MHTSFIKMKQTSLKLYFSFLFIHFNVIIILLNVKWNNSLKKNKKKTARNRSFWIILWEKTKIEMHKQPQTHTRVAPFWLLAICQDVQVQYGLAGILGFPN
jgi:hypothetical protein